MICYKDKTFCHYFLICKNGNKCDKALTKEIINDTIKSELHISRYTDFPDCFKTIKTQENKCKH